MNSYITTHDQWLEEYRKDKRAIWVRVLLSDGREIYFKDYGVWKDLKETCQKEVLSIKQVKLQYRSHVIEEDVDGAEGVYLVRSVMGQIGGDSSNYYVIGRVVGDKVLKTSWLTPELIQEENFEDTLDNCFEEAIIYQHEKETD
tara:strand:+ start:54 stop:485 length:432 start_codon:yes stop_codon:yes gene_type:complete